MSLERIGGDGDPAIDRAGRKDSDAMAPAIRVDSRAAPRHRPAARMEATSAGRARAVFAWTLYDFANSAFVTTVVAAVLPVYYASVAGASLGGNRATVYWAYTVSASALVSALLGPVLGAVADLRGKKKRFLGFFLGMGALATALLYFVGRGDVALASGLFLFANVGFTGSLVFYDALLPHVAAPEEMDRVSSRGYAMGYVGGGILLAVNLAMITLARPESTGLMARLSFLSVAVWWVAFSVPLFRDVAEPPPRVLPGEERVSALVAGFSRVAATFRDARRRKDLFLFLIAFLIYNNGIGTIIHMATIYGAEIGIGRGTLLGTLLLVQVVAAPFAILFGRIAERVGRKRAIFFSLFVYVCIAFFGQFMRTPRISGRSGSPWRRCRAAARRSPALFTAASSRPGNRPSILVFMGSARRSPASSARSSSASLVKSPTAAGARSSRSSRSSSPARSSYRASTRSAVPRPLRADDGQNGARIGDIFAVRSGNMATGSEGPPMQFTPRKAPVEQPSDLERIGKQAALLQVKLSGVASLLRDRENGLAREVVDDIDGLAQALSGFRRSLEQHREEQDGVMSREAKMALFEVSRAITSSLDLKTVLNQVMDSVIDLTKAERGYLVLLDDKGGQSVEVARNIDQDTIRSIEFAFSSSVVEEVLKSDRSVLTNNAQTDERFALNSSVTMFRLTSIMAAPLRIRGKVIGVLYVDNRVFAGQFSQQKLEMLEAFAGQAAIAIHNAKLFGQTDEALKERLAELERLYKELALSRERAEQGLAAANREMQIGRVIQSEFLPRELPSMPGWQLAARFLPARNLSGDFYDVYRLPAGDIAIAIADVCDKGVGAALFMSLVRGLLRSNASRARGRHEVLSTVAQTNNFLADNHGRTAMFTTLFFGVLDPDTGELIYINCGHDAPIVIGAGGEEARLDSSGPALGAIRDVDIETGRIVLLPGDTLVAFTDGVIDALDRDETQFGEERFLPIVRGGSPSVTAMLGEIEVALRRHIGEAPQYDDITLLALHRNGLRRDVPTVSMPATVPPPAVDPSGRRTRR